VQAGSGQPSARRHRPRIALQLCQRPHGCARHGGIRIACLTLQLDADLIGLILIAQARKRLNHLNPRFLLGALQQGQQQVHRFGVAELTDCPHHHRDLLGRTRAQHFVHARTARLLPISASASTARSLTHQSLSLVASIR